MIQLIARKKNGEYSSATTERAATANPSIEMTERNPKRSPPGRPQFNGTTRADICGDRRTIVLPRYRLSGRI